MNQVRVEGRSANFTHNSDAEKASHKTLARKERNQEKSVQQNRERMVEEIIEAGVQFRAHQEKATVNGGKHNELRKTTDPIALKEIEVALFEKPEEHHAEQVFKNADRGKNVEETVLGIVAIEPKVIGKAKEGRPENARNKERSEKNPKRAVALLEKPTAEPRRYSVANEKAGKRPRRFIQLHAEVRDNGPGERDVQE